MAKKNQSKRLTSQHKRSHGVEGIFGLDAKKHDFTVEEVSHAVLQGLESEFPKLNFRYRDSLRKEEINIA